MQCPVCKKENPANGKFCEHCGTKLDGQPRVEAGDYGRGMPPGVYSSNADTLPLTAPNPGNAPGPSPSPYSSQPGSGYAGTITDRNRPGKGKTIIAIACICLVLLAGAFYAYRYLNQGQQFIGTWYKIGSGSNVVISKTNNVFNLSDYDGDHKTSYKDGQLLVEFKEGTATASIDKDGQMILAMYGMSETYKKGLSTDTKGPTNDGKGDEDGGGTGDKNGDDSGKGDTDSDKISGQTIPARLQSGDNSNPVWTGLWNRVIASSTLAPEGSSSYEPALAIDQDGSTAWVEGSSDAGENEWLELESDTPQRISTIQILNGYDKSNDIFYANNRIEKIRIDFSDGTYIYSTLLDGYGVISEIDLGQAIKTSSIRITIQGVYPGTRFNDTCLSEVRAF